MTKLGVGVACFLLGAFLGGAFTSRQMEVLQYRQDDVVHEADRNAAITLASELAQCTAKFQTYTILYEPGAEPSVPLFNGLLSIQANMPVQAGPKWIVPAKIEPVVSAASPNFTYSYFDIHTRRLDGPYLPKTAAEMAAQQPATPPQPTPSQPITNSGYWPIQVH